MTISRQAAAVDGLGYGRRQIAVRGLRPTQVTVSTGSAVGVVEPLVFFDDPTPDVTEIAVTGRIVFSGTATAVAVAPVTGRAQAHTTTRAAATAVTAITGTAAAHTAGHGHARAMKSLRRQIAEALLIIELEDQ